jgi:hypothetical protein
MDKQAYGGRDPGPIVFFFPKAWFGLGDVVYTTSLTALAMVTTQLNTKQATHLRQHQYFLSCREDNAPEAGGTQFGRQRLPSGRNLEKGPSPTTCDGLDSATFNLGYYTRCNTLAELPLSLSQYQKIYPAARFIIDRLQNLAISLDFLEGRHWVRLLRDCTGMASSDQIRKEKPIYMCDRRRENGIRALHQALGRGSSGCFGLPRRSWRAVSRGHHVGDAALFVDEKLTAYYYYYGKSLKLLSEYAS